MKLFSRCYEVHGTGNIDFVTDCHMSFYEEAALLSRLVRNRVAEAIAMDLAKALEVENVRICIGQSCTTHMRSLPPRLLGIPENEIQPMLDRLTRTIAQDWTFRLFPSLVFLIHNSLQDPKIALLSGASAPHLVPQALLISREIEDELRK